MSLGSSHIGQAWVRPSQRGIFREIILELPPPLCGTVEEFDTVIQRFSENHQASGYCSQQSLIWHGMFGL